MYVKLDHMPGSIRGAINNQYVAFTTKNGLGWGLIIILCIHHELVQEDTDRPDVAVTVALCQVLRWYLQNSVISALVIN